MRTVYTDRSRIETYQRCPRLRYEEYHRGGLGIQSAHKPLPLAVGGSVHVGLEHLLLGAGEDAAVVEALDDFSSHRDALAIDTAEQAAMVAIDPNSFHAQLIATAADLGMSEDDPAIVAMRDSHAQSVRDFDAWLYTEQSALVEGMVRAYARRRLAPLLAEYEVLEVEREGQWVLSEDGPHAIWFMSRPDALLRSRQDGNLYLLSYKTTATWDIRKGRDAEHDMQGLSEAVEVERRLGERVMGIRYEYLLKGGRWEDKDLSQRFGIKVWSQRSHLIRKYVATSTPSRGQSTYSVGDECWSYDYIKEDGSTSKLAWQNWRSRPVWEDGSVREWIDKLDAGEEAMSAYDPTVGQEPRPLGWKSSAQALGYTATHPLDDVFPAPLMVYRSDDQARDWVEQVEAQERRVAEGVAQVEAAEDEGERRHLLNVLFPMTRRACEYPTTCSMSKICWGGEDIQRDPIGSGLYKSRIPNHPQEIVK